MINKIQVQIKDLHSFHFMILNVRI